MADTKELRSSKRRRLAHEAGLTDGENFLVHSCVGSATRKSYRDLLKAFEGWMPEALEGMAAAEVDRRLAGYLEHLFLEGEQLHVGTMTLAAVLDAFPGLGRGSKTALPVSRQALQGWKKLGPPKARLPLPWAIVGAIAHWLAEHQGPRMALVTVLAFHLYLRPWVAASLVAEQFTPPLRERGASGGRSRPKPEQLWTVNLHLQEWERPSKTGTWDETVEIADHEKWAWIAQCLEALWGRQPRGGVPLGAMRNVRGMPVGDRLMPQTQQ
jgi:hypothetical protein